MKYRLEFCTAIHEAHLALAPALVPAVVAIPLGWLVFVVAREVMAG